MSRKSNASDGNSEHIFFSHNMYFDIIFRRVDFPLPFLPTITFTPGLNINSEPFLNAFIFGIYSNGVFLLSSILIEVGYYILFYTRYVVKHTHVI